MSEASDSRESTTAKLCRIAILAGAFGMAGVVVYAAAGPIVTDDLWWHLKMGEMYLGLGLWPDADPLLHTAHTDAPIQHEWLFGVFLHGIDQLGGFYALRALHAVAVIAISVLVFWLGRRVTGSAQGGAFVLAVFLSVAWLRLYQLRPDLFSIPATLIVYALLLAPDAGPNRGRIAGATLLFLVWVNVHSLFAVGLLLVGAGCTAAFAVGQHARGRRLLWALAVAGTATLLNPRGIDQHLTFFTSTQASAIWLVRDEWTPFRPWAPEGYGWSVSVLAWLITTVLLGLWGLAAIRSLRAFRRRSASVDWVLLAVSGASIVAFCVSIRFLWLSVFPWIFVLRTFLSGQRFGHPAIAAIPAATVLAIAAAFPFQPGFQAFTRGLWKMSAAEYWGSPFHPSKYYPELQRFLQGAGLEGNLFNPYTLGGFLSYWHAPKLRTFIDGRTEHYSADVFQEYFRVNMQRGFLPEETDLDILDRRGVDIVIGVGLPTGGPRNSDQTHYSTANLERAPGWRLANRSYRHAVYLRVSDANRENWERVARYYAEEGVPFDPSVGFDVSRVAREQPDWSKRNALLPRNFDALEQTARTGAATDRVVAMGTLARFYALTGAYEEQVALDRRSLELRPKSERTLQRLIYGLLRLDRGDEAAAAAFRLSALPPHEARSSRFMRAAHHYARRQAPPGQPMDAWINGLPLIARGRVPTY